MQQFERSYAEIVEAILAHGYTKEGRNGKTKSIHGMQLKVPCNNMPLLEGRKIYYEGVLGELAAMFRGPKHVRDFEQFGCNYWGQWADADGSLCVDYGNAWLPQLYDLANNIKKNPYGRRHIINGWRPKYVDKLSLPCCHYSYQFLVTPEGTLDMIWIQRSVDTMVGLPSDIILAWAWLAVLADECMLLPGTITMQLGDCHIYEEHFANAEIYLERVKSANYGSNTIYRLERNGRNFYQFTPDWIKVVEYNNMGPLKFEVKS